MPAVAAFVGIVLTAFLLAAAVPAPRWSASVVAPATVTAHEAVAETPAFAPDQHLCIAVSEIVEDSANEVERYRRDGQAERIARLRAAEEQLSDYSRIAGPGLGDVVGDLGNALGGLRAAFERGGDTWAATDAVLRRIDALEAACGPRLARGL